MPTKLDLDQARQDFEEAFYRFYIAQIEYTKYIHARADRGEKCYDPKSATEKSFAKVRREVDRASKRYYKAIIESRKESAKE